MTQHAALIGLGAHLPPRQVTNDDLSRTLDTSDEWITTRTGIRTRRWATPGQATGDLAVEAGERALKSAGLAAEPGAVDALVLATTTPDHPCPATAPQVAARLGLGPVAAYDMGAACSGFLYALAAAAGQIAAGQARRVLVIGAETMSSLLDKDDRTTAVIFGDGAGAAVLAAEPDAAAAGVLLATDLGSDGSGFDLAYVPGGGSREAAAAPVRDPGAHRLTMQGEKVFAHAVARMAGSVTALLGRAGWEAGEVDRLVGHQANIRILTSLARRLDFPADRLVVNIDRVGNTSAASIPLALTDAVTAGELKEGDRVVLAAFGGGLTWGSVALTWPGITAV
ncbi:ketoacyl-ACP synthase III [Streptomyces sp. NBC_01808]|uniref:beta-ketoacyl-ACP synthase III n=1 Tax=Streptomyces sp. NBC_01808 TaxID=2975947 RepID=UPI002DD7B212|nr:beta-ketoacyl-ACP synthase III [Streptomyces sp. NBC_01808]WSA42260.1 ketoacyl-ACP synthase III [Streptomyces sp. NBC_01808]